MLVWHHCGALQLGKSHEGLKKPCSSPWNSPLHYWKVTVEDPLTQYGVLGCDSKRKTPIEEDSIPYWRITYRKEFVVASKKPCRFSKDTKSQKRNWPSLQAYKKA
jgi:hypothetical protein